MMCEMIGANVVECSVGNLVIEIYKVVDSEFL